MWHIAIMKKIYINKKNFISLHDMNGVRNIIKFTT